MENIKHTPGPWTANSADNIYALVGNRQEMIARILDLPCLGGNDDASAMRAREQEKANARLVAAAPEMFVALKIAEAHIAELREAWQRGAIAEYDGQGGTRSNRNVDASIAIRKAISKAEGE